MRQFIYIYIIGSIFFSCNSDDIQEAQTNPCDNEAQGLALSDDYLNQTENYLINDQNLTVHYVTGHPQGNYFHIFNNNGPNSTNFYTFAVNSGETSTLAQNWNTAAGSFLSINSNPYYGSQQYPINLTTLEGGNQVGDRILIEFSGYAGEGHLIEGQYCVNIDEVITTADYVYITDSVDFKIINVFDPYLPYIEQSIPANTAYFIEVINNVAYLGYFDAIQPFLNSYEVSDPNNISPINSIAKSSQFGRLTDIEKIGNYIYVSDEYKGAHHINTNTQNITSFESHDVMSLSLINNRLTCLGIWAGLYGFDVSTANTPINSNFTLNNLTDIDIASYPHTNGSFHSWVRNDGTHHYVANISDQKLKKIEEESSQFVNYSIINELDILGYVTAFTIEGDYGFVTTRASALAPLQTSFDGIKMIDLNTMSIIDSYSLSNASGVTLKANVAYVTDENGLHIYDVSQGNLNLINTYNQGFGNYISINN